MSTALRYHEATKYDPETIGNHPGLDWDRQPVPYKQYHAEVAVELAEFLPLDPNPFGVPTRAVPDGGGRNLASLSRWIYFTYGVTALIRQPERTQLLRAAPSAGGLFPAELYVVIRDWPGIEPGLYGYDPVRHRLVSLWAGSDIHPALVEACYGSAAVAAAPVLAVVTGVFERSRWRYQERAYRRILLDVGHVLGNAGLAAHALGLRTHITAAFCDDRANAALRLDEDDEGVLAVIALDETGQLRRPAWTALPSLAPDGVDNGLLVAVHRSSRLSEQRPRLVARAEASIQALEAAHGWASGPQLAESGCGRPSELAAAPLATILRRRSCRSFRRTTFSREALSRILAAAEQPERVGLGEHPGLDRSRLSTFIAILDVEGLAPGVYYLSRQQLELRPVRLGDAREAARYVALGQELGGDAGAVVFHTADLQAAVRELGDRSYRYLHLDAGMIGERLNLAAVAEGLGASGIGGFFDDQTADLLGIPRDQAVVYITVLGTPAA